MRLRPVAVDQINFKSPSHVGDRVTVSAQVTRVFGNTLEIFIRVTSDPVSSQDRQTEVNVGYLILEVYDVYDESDASPAADLNIPDIVPCTIEQEQEYRKAEARQQFRRQRLETASKMASIDGKTVSVNFKPDTCEA